MKSLRALSTLPFLISSFASAGFEYAGDYHKFSVPDSLYDISIADITVPGTHNSFNRSGIGGGCAPTSIITTNMNVHSSITEQIEMGVRLLELDVYKTDNGNWCLFHGSGGNAALDGNSYYFSDIIAEIAEGLKGIGKEIIYLKIDGGQLDSETLLAELDKHGLKDSIYQRQDGEEAPPSLNELAQLDKRLVIIGGGNGLGWGWSMASTSPKYTNRHEPFSSTYTHANGVDAVRWNAFALDDVFTYGSTGDADYIHARILPGALEKWAQAGRRITSLVVDFPRRESVNMTAMRAATILNQIPSVKGDVATASGDVINGVRFNYWAEDLNLATGDGRYIMQDYKGRNVVTNEISGSFDFPRPHGQGVTIRPFKEGYRFEPASIYVEAEDIANTVNISFTAIQEKDTPQSIAESYSFIYKQGNVDLAPGLDVSEAGQVVVNDTTRQDGFALINKGTGLCVGVGSDHAYTDAPVTMQICDASPRQRWNYNPQNGHLKTVLGNYCLDTEGSGNSGHRQQLYSCIEHRNLTFDLVGQRIVPAYTSANALDSHGRSPGASLTVWNRNNDYHDNRFWIFEKHFAVSSTDQNTVTSSAADDKQQYFMLVNESRNNCLTADGTGSQSRVSARDCRGGDTSLKLWSYADKQFKLKANRNSCLDNKGQLWQDSEPHIWNCIAGHPNMSFQVNMPYQGGAARSIAPVAITPQENANVFLDHPRDSLVRLANFENKVGNQGWVVVPVSVD
ncbi:ricin-type beta-trefoil lectin domain protein [Parendozoicomonas sp. Alg238-R29]|uniref:ricin-type beta-trefoil lectin domain protein n=1 Tax=Parendozoicomonas sp. Alg238-R29 TaxID=2993446 RepID=UPI00248E0229|nr:ricin-type beta-trefoil lectin domain protein [Parendozoicomonas sp. Alg238-R29]